LKDLVRTRRKHFGVEESQKICEVWRLVSSLIAC